MLQKLKNIVRVQSRTYLENYNIFTVTSRFVRRIITSCLLLLTFYASPVYAAAPTPCVDADSIKAGFGPCPSGLTEIEGVVGNIISVIVGLGFIAMLVLLLMAGFKYLTSGGEPKAISAAHQTFTWALLGVFLLAVAWLILQLIANFTGLPITIFNIKTLCGDPNDPTKWFCKP